MRGRLIFPLLAELHRLDVGAMTTLAPGYDDDFKEPALLDLDGDGVSDAFRREHPPIRVPCQVEPEILYALRMTPSGEAKVREESNVKVRKVLSRLLIELPASPPLPRAGHRPGGGTVRLGLQ